MRYARTIACTLATAWIIAAPPASAMSAKAGAADHKAASDLVRHFFEGYDRHDPKIVKATFSADAGIVHADASLTDNVTLEKGIARDRNGPKPRRTFGNFEFTGSGPVMVAAFDMTVSRQEPGRGSTTYKYRESWYLKRTAAGWRAFWVNYVPYGTDESAELATRAAAKKGERRRLAGEEEQAAQFVEGFFEAYKNADAPALKAMFLPGAKIVHMIALEQSVGAFADELVAQREPKYKYARPKPAPFDNFHFRKVGNFILIAFDNHVSHWRDGHPEIEHTFRENWLLQNGPAGMKTVWASYSVYGAKTPNLARKAKR